MIRQTPAASRQVEALTDYYLEKGRYQAALNLEEAFLRAVRQIEANPYGGLKHPKPYPGIARWGFHWVKIHRYWFGWSIAKDYPVLTNVHFDTSDMQGRVAAGDGDDIPI